MVTKEDIENIAILSKLFLAEEDFRNNMTNSLSEIQIGKKEIEVSREDLKREKEQFEAYKSLELARIDQNKRQIDDEKEQFIWMGFCG